MTFEPSGLSRAAQAWPSALTAGPEGLTLDGCPLAQLARDHGTPLWAISRSTVESNYEGLRDAFQRRYPNSEVAYSIKANNTGAVIRLLSLAGAKADCSAEHEFELALRAGVPPEDVILNGNGKSDAALLSAARIGVRQVNVDSREEVGRLNSVAGRLGVRVPCCVRVQLGYRRLLELDPSFESTLRIGEGKFGTNVGSGEARDTIAAVAGAEHLDLCGLSHHVGFSGYMGDFSADRELMHHRECARELCELANEVAREIGARVDRLDLGGGFRSHRAVLLSTPGAGADVAYHRLPMASEYAEVIFDTLERTLPSDHRPLVQFECGGGVIGDAIVLLAGVSEVKDVGRPPMRRYVVIDASMMMFVSRGMMRVGHPVVLVERPLDQVRAELAVEVVGQTCVYDSIAEDIRLPEVRTGEVIAILNQGAYCETESTQFNAFPRPAVVLLDQGEATIVKRREHLDDIVARDLVLATAADHERQVALRTDNRE